MARFWDVRWELPQLRLKSSEPLGAVNLSVGQGFLDVRLLLLHLYPIYLNMCLGFLFSVQWPLSSAAKVLGFLRSYIYSIP